MLIDNDSIQRNDTIIADIFSKTSIYLFYDNRLFSVWCASDKGYSFPVSKNKFEELSNFFKANNIAYKELPLSCYCIDEDTSISDPANTQLTFLIGGEWYTLYNYNSYLLKYSTAESISLYLTSMNIKNEYVIIGNRAKLNNREFSNDSSQVNLYPTHEYSCASEEVTTGDSTGEAENVAAPVISSVSSGFSINTIVPTPPLTKERPLSFSSKAKGKKTPVLEGQLGFELIF